MAREPKKKRYEGPKLRGDDAAYRDARAKRAAKNSQSAASASNESFAATDPTFIARCKAAGIPATGRQASKFRRGRGLAFHAEVPADG